MFSLVGSKPFEVRRWGDMWSKVFAKFEGKKFNENFRGQSFCTILWYLRRCQVLV